MSSCHGYKSQSSEESGFSYGEVGLVVKDECGDKYNVRLLTEPDPELLALTANQLAQQLLVLFSRKLVVTKDDVLALNVLCSYSSVTVNNPLGISGTFIGQDATSDAIASALNSFKNSNYNGNQFSVTSRLRADDILLFNVVINLLQSPTGPVLGSITFSGEYQIIECGAKLCVDFLTVHVASNIS
jgi:hypothetical protein